MSPYLDASVLLPIVVPEPDSAAIDHFMARASATVLVSEFAVAEVGSAVSRLVRMRALDEEHAVQRLIDFDAWRAIFAELVDVEGSDVRSAGTIVRRFEPMLRPPMPCIWPFAAASTPP